MKLETLKGTPVAPSIISAPVTPSGTARTMASGPRKLPNCATSSSSTAPSARASTPSSSRNDACWLAYCPPISSVTPAGSATRAQRAPHVAHHAAQAAAAGPAGHRDVGPQVLAPELARPAGVAHLAKLAQREPAAGTDDRHPRDGVAPVSARCPAAAPGSGPGGPARAPCRPRRRTGPRAPGPAPRPRVSPSRATRAGIELHPPLGVRALHAVEQVHQARASARSPRATARAARSAARLVPAEQLELDRLGRAGQVADHVLHELHELHPHRGRPLLRRRAHPVDHLRTPTAAVRAA